jgi:tRNA (mo5U34)-methyltransferase
VRPDGHGWTNTAVPWISRSGQFLNLKISVIPEERYAKMPNVYFIPTVPVLFTWLKSAGFKNIRCADVSVTTIEEQRKTEWIKTETLADFLDPADSSKTIEGYPAPVRAVVIAGF